MEGKAGFGGGHVDVYPYYNVMCIRMFRLCSVSNEPGILIN